MLEKTKYTVDRELLETAKSMFINDTVVLNEPTGNFFYDPWVIKDQYKDSIWNKFLSTLPMGKGEARLIVLKPGETYMAHADIDDRWHLNISGNYSFLIDIGNNKMYELKQDAIWYEMDAGKIHVASNFGEIYRVQLVVRKLLMRCKLSSKTLIKIIPAYEQKDYRYKFDNLVSPWLNRLNKYGAIDNFKFDNLQVEFDLATSLIPMIKEIEKPEFQIVYE